jgi:thiol-disulfide isomerase/thioredoxin
MRTSPLVLTALLLAAPALAEDAASTTPIPAVATVANTHSDSAEPDPAALVGKAPPPLSVAKWVKGDPLTKFEPGKVYVVDFWATWCGPCKAAIPHLTRLQKEHAGKLEIIGVSISERMENENDISYMNTVAKFVDIMGDQMDYRVAVDGPEKTIYKTWFKPTGTGGIPTAYIIDQHGNVAWTGIGSPETVSRIVNLVLEGKFDPAAEAQYQKQLEAQAKERAKADAAAAANGATERDKTFPGLDAALKRDDPSAALEIVNQAFQKNPALEIQPANYQQKFMLLLTAGKRKEVEAYSRDLMKRFPGNVDIVDWIAAILVAPSEDSRFDPALTLEASEKSLASAKPDSRWQQFAKWRLAWAQFHAGQKDKAIATANDALASIDRLKGKVDVGDLADELKVATHTFEKAN